jgi:hypothetical protein
MGFTLFSEQTEIGLCEVGRVSSLEVRNEIQIQYKEITSGCNNLMFHDKSNHVHC